MQESVLTKDLFVCSVEYLSELFEKSRYPWEILPKIKDHISKLLQSGIPGFREIEKGILAGENVRIAPSATVEAPAILGEGTEVRQGAYLRGNVITGPQCVIGNSSEVKHSVLLRGVKIPHYNYVGDSILGNYAHMGAGAICSNLKADGREVVVHAERAFRTGLRKLGGVLGDGADIGCGSVLNPGTVVGRGTSVYPLCALRGVLPPDCIVKSMAEIVKREERN